MGRKPMTAELRSIQRHTGCFRTMGDVEFFAKVMYKKGAQDAVRQTTNARTIIALWVLHDKFGFGKKRLSQFLEEQNAFTDTLNAKLVSQEETLEALKTECQVTINL